ncbi:MAG: PepSY domain-containing protein [Cytophagales bacterium]|nr:PepSY domain-containing protein [Cytophagales bacterium]
MGALWVGLGAGLVLSVVGVTGSLYVLEPEGNGWLHGEVLRSQHRGTPLPLDRLVRRAEATLGDQVVGVWFPLRKVETYGFAFQNREQTEYFDPYTGEHLGHIPPEKDFFGLVLEVHRTLTLGETGRRITSVSALLMAFFVLSSGIYLWWPRHQKQLRQGFTVKWPAGPKRLQFDLHKVGGFYACLPLFLLAVTGAYFCFPDQYQAVLNFLTRSRQVPHTFVGLASRYQPGRPPLTVYQVLPALDTLYPGYQRRSLYVSPDSAGLVTISFLKSRGVEAGGFYRAQVALDKYSGRVLFNYDPLAAPLGTQLTKNWVFPVHYGEIGGWPTRLLALVAGLMPLLLLFTGFRMYLNRRRKKPAGRRKNAHATMPQPAVAAGAAVPGAP